MAFTGCASTTNIGGDTNATTFWKPVTDNILSAWRSNSCNVDLDGKHGSGDQYDRAACAMFVTRQNICPLLSEGPSRTSCVAATDPNAATRDYYGKMYLSFDHAASLAAAKDCLSITFWPGNPAVVFGWTAVSLGQYSSYGLPWGCRVGV